jgi:alpha-mannosidase
MLNDGRYGYNIMDAALDIDLVRTTTYPGDNGDIGEHSFIYSLFPHKADFTNGVIREAYKLNIPLAVVDGTFKEDITPIIDIGAENVILEAVKKAEDGDEIVLRLYEAYGVETLAPINLHGKKAELADILERRLDGRDIDLEKGLPFKPFEVHTLIIQ